MALAVDQQPSQQAPGWFPGADAVTNVPGDIPFYVQPSPVYAQLPPVQVTAWQLAQQPPGWFPGADAVTGHPGGIPFCTQGQAVYSQPPPVNATVTPGTAAARAAAPGSGRGYTGLLALMSAAPGGDSTVTALPGTAAATGTSLQPVQLVGAHAGLASATAAALQPSFPANAAAATATAAAYAPFISYGAGLASGTGSALSPPAQVTALPGVATGTGAALAPAGQVGDPAGVASGTGAAFAPTAQVTGADPTGALGTGAAYQLSATEAAYVYAGNGTPQLPPGWFPGSDGVAGSPGGIPFLTLPSPAQQLLTIATPGTASAAGAASLVTFPLFSAVGTLGSATASGFTLTPHATGDFILLWVTAETTADYATALSSSNATWSVLVAHHAFTNNTVVQTVFVGDVTSTSGAAVTVTLAAGSPTLRIAWQEFSCAGGYAAVALDASGTTDTTSGGTMPPVTPSRAGDLYAGYVYDNGSGSVGSTSGYVYQLDTNDNQYAYNVNSPNSTQTPNIGDANGTSGIGVMMLLLGASAGVAAGTGASLGPVAQVTALPGAATGTGAASGPAAKVTALPGVAAGTGTAYAPLAGSGNASAGAAPGTGAAFGPAAQVTALPGVAAGTGAALAPGSSRVPGTASGTGAALQSPAGPGPVPGRASAAGAAYPPRITLIRFPENLGAVLTLPSPSASTTEQPFGGTITVADLGGTLTLAAFGASLTGWTMQTAPLNLLEFNDVTINLAITNNGSPYSLAGATLNLLFKTQAGTPDVNALLFSTAGGSPAISITNSSGGLAVAQIPNVDLDSETYTFYRVDVVVGGFQNTCISGPVTWTSL